MINWKTVVLAAFCWVGLSSTMALAMDQKQDFQKEKMQNSDRIYGQELMTPEELETYRIKMNTLKTTEEREAYRVEHSKKMQKLAKVKGGMSPSGRPRVPRGGMGGFDEGSGR